MAAIERRVEIFIMEISRSSYSCLNQMFDNFPSSHMVFMLSDADSPWWRSYLKNQLCHLHIEKD